MRNERPVFPKRAVITGGMPYGNKSLHFGHVGGVFVHADTLYRFLQDRIGAENVIFVSGTDCYGSPILASYKKYLETAEQPLSLEDFVLSFHEDQKRVLSKFQIEPSFFAASAFGDGGRVHSVVSETLFEELYGNGMLHKCSTLQFYDRAAGAYLNGRQVVGQCPVDGCRSEKAYADECDLGHQYQPEELIDPVSTLSGSKPQLVSVDNWYFDLPAYQSKLRGMIDDLKRLKRIRPNVYTAIEEFLKAPMIYVKRADHERLTENAGSWDAPLYDELSDDGKKPSVTYIYRDLASRDRARALLDAENIRYRTGKTLVPFRLSGNVDWGVPVPDRDGLNGLTFWVWPESLWAPVSFTIAHLEKHPEKEQDWKKWWFSEDAQQYQVIGEDNVYFYGIAQPGLTMGHLGIRPEDERSMSGEQYTQLISNSHLLFMGRKASSSSDFKPPMAEELLDYYTVDQLRMAFLGLGLSKKSASFSPLAFAKIIHKKIESGEIAAEDAEELIKALPPLDQPDPVLKDGNVLTHVFNRVLRSCFYTAQKYTDSRIPTLEPREEIKALIERAVLEYERNMARHEFHLVVFAVDDIIRKVSKHWAKYSKNCDSGEAYAQVLADCFYACKVILLLLHPITPVSAEEIRIRMNLDESLWNWDHVFAPITRHMADPAMHRIQEIEARHDFYKRHHTQLGEEDSAEQ